MDLRLITYRNKSSLNWNHNTSFDDLPDGLVTDILLRIPAKTLVQSTCVCKLWFSIIKSTSFVSSHLSWSISRPFSYYIYLFANVSHSIAVLSDNHLLTRHPDFKFAFETQFIDLQLIGAAKGLVCVMNCYLNRVVNGHDIYLINPFIHKYKKLYSIYSCYANWFNNFHHRLIGTKVGFGYSDVENDYKVVRIFNRYPYRRRRFIIPGYDYSPRVVESKVEIYSLKSGKWRALDISIDLSSYYSPIFLHGCLYWNVYQIAGPDKYLLSFDLKDEVFNRIELPTNYLQIDSRSNSNILIKNDSVALLVYNKDPNNVCPTMRIYLFVLEMNFGEQLQWKEFIYECADFNVVKCIGFSGVGRLIFVEKDLDSQIDHVVAVDLDNSCAIEKLAVDFNVINNGATDVLESLVLSMD